MRTEHVTWHAVVTDGVRVVTAVEEQHGAFEADPVLLPRPLRRQLDLSLLVYQPVLHHQPTVSPDDHITSADEAYCFGYR